MPITSDSFKSATAVTTTLLPAEDAHFRWMLGRGEGPSGLSLPPGGVDAPEILRIVRQMTHRLHEAGCRASWLMLYGNEVVGLCSYKQPPKDGAVEIGYGVAASRRRLGHATRAVALMLEHARTDPLVDRVMAGTAAANQPSQRALEKNGFVRSGRGEDAEDGELVFWTRDLS